MAMLSRDPRQLLLERKLAPFRTLPLIRSLTQRLFQKCPAFLKELEGQWDRVPPSDRHYVGIQFLTRTILDVLDQKSEAVPAGCGLPSKLESYLSFMDLAWVTLKSSETADTPLGGPRIQWHTFVLREHRPPTDISFHKLRHRLKKLLPDNHLASVQMDLDYADGQDEPRRMFFRVVSVKRTRSAASDEQRLLKKNAFFFAYYTHEPYFYCDRSDFDPIYGEAVHRCLYSSGFEPLPLSGHDLASLRQIRLHRDGKLPPLALTRRPLYNAANPFNILDTSDEVGEELELASRSIPSLSKLTLKSSSQFTASPAVQDFHQGRLPLLTENLDFEVITSGPDVLKGLNSMVNNSRVPYFGPLLPHWVQEVGNRGRNVIHINVDKENHENSTHLRAAKRGEAEEKADHGMED